MADKTKLKTQDEVAESIEDVELDEEDGSDSTDPNRGLTATKGRPTLSRRAREEAEEDQGNFIQRTVRGLRGYFEGVQSELAKVAWPTREETRRLTQIVIIALIIASVILGGISFGFTRLFAVGLDSPVLLLGTMFLAVGGALVWNRVQSRRSSNL